MDVTCPETESPPLVAPPIVAIGASAGGVEALRQVVEDLEPESAAAAFVVLHVPPQSSALPAILGRRCRHQSRMHWREIRSGAVDQVLPLAEIPTALLAAVALPDPG